jgi:NAD dependent epimerase/dehydratase family enzyme
MAPVPALALKIALGSELATDAVLASQRVLPKVLVEEGFSFEDSTVASIVSSALRT